MSFHPGTLSKHTLLKRQKEFGMSMGHDMDACRDERFSHFYEQQTKFPRTQPQLPHVRAPHLNTCLLKELMMHKNCAHAGASTHTFTHAGTRDENQQNQSSGCAKSLRLLNVGMIFWVELFIWSCFQRSDNATLPFLIKHSTGSTRT